VNTLGKFSRASDIMSEMKGLKHSAELMVVSCVMAVGVCLVLVQSRLKRLVRF
jgi:hypothetical protein